MLAIRARDLWLEELRVRSCSSATLRAYLDHTTEAFRDIAAFLDVEPAELTLDEFARDGIVAALAAYRARPDGRSGRSRERSPNSVGMRLRGMKSFLSWCVTTEKLGRSPATSVKAPTPPQRVPKALPVEACHRIVEAADRSRWPERDRLVVLCGLALGLRLSAITGLELGSFSPSVDAPTHVKVLGKGAKERTVPVPAAVRAALAAYLPTRAAQLDLHGATSQALFVARRGAGTAMTRDGVAAVFDRALRAADLKAPGLRVHTTRHSFATAGIASRVFDLEEMRTLLGHASIATTQVYLKVDPERLAAASEHHPFGVLTPAA
jgi:site-specific recombinase XerD